MAISNPTRFWAIVAFITVSIAWGTTYAGIAVAVESIPPFLLSGVRFFFAGLMLFLVLRLWGIAAPSSDDWKRLAPQGVLLLCCANGLLGWAEQYIDSSYAALLVNSGPFIFVGLSALAGEPVPRLAWVGLCIGFCGLLVLVSPSIFGEAAAGKELHPFFRWAVAALIIGPICWSTGSFFAKRAPPKCHHFMIAAGQNIAGGLGAMVVSLCVGELSVVHVPTRESVYALIYLLFVGSWIGYIAYIYCVIHLPPHRTATTVYLNMVVAVLVGWLFLGEELTPPMLIGGAIMLAGVWTVNLARTKPRVVAVLPAEPVAASSGKG